MAEEFLAHYIKKIVRDPEAVSVSKVENPQGCDFIIYASSQDIGRIVGREGKMIAAIKAFISGCKAKNGLNYKVLAKAIDA